MKSYSLYYIADNGDIYSSGVLAKRLKQNKVTITEVVKVYSKTTLDKLRERDINGCLDAIYRGPAKRG